MHLHDRARLENDASKGAIGLKLTVLLTGAVKADDLVTEDVISRGERLGDGDSPLAIGGNELVGSPSARGGGAVNQTSLVDLW